MKLGTILMAGLTMVATGRAGLVVTEWIPIFKGVARAAGTNFPPTAYEINGAPATDSTLQVANCVRIDLTDPDVRLFPTPRSPNYVPNSSETLALTVTNFMRIYGLQVASDANFYMTSQGSDPSTEGISANVEGLMMTTGQVVSAVGDNRYATLFFTSNKEPTVLFNNTSPGTNVAAFFTAISGFYPIVSNGMNFGLSASNGYSDFSIHYLQPRTAIGISQDKRYLYMMTIDGRQGGYSNGAYDTETAMWLLLFGAWDAINMDGGGSTSMYMSDCSGGAIGLGHSSYISLRNRERIIGAHIGVYAQPLSAFLNNITATPGSTTATITWTTPTNSTSQIQYGLTLALGSSSSFDPTLVTNHSVTLSGLTPGTLYYFRVLSRVGTEEYSSSCSSVSFTTTNFGIGLLFGMGQDWKWQTNNLDGVNWTSPTYDDSGWTNHGSGPLWADTRATTNFSIPNITTGTRLPHNVATTYPFTTYYFRAAAVFSNSTAGVTLLFSNYIDDGAVFYLNGTEIFRTNMIAPPTSIANGSNAIASPCGDATCAMLFNVTGDLMTNLFTGTNIFAVEVHNYRNPIPPGGNPSPDATFESAVLYSLPPPPPPLITNVIASAGETNATITWTTYSNATSQVQYGKTAGLGSSTPLDATPVTNHTVTLTGLQPNTFYYFRVVSTLGGNQFTEDGTFSTVSLYVPLVALTNAWRYTTNGFGGSPLATNWTALNYNDSAWIGQGAALLYIEDNPAVEPRRTALPSANGQPRTTYYFRTHFTVSTPLSGLALLFTNYIDDGAVLYLNGVEVQRVRMPAGPVTSATLASGCPVNNCEATLDVPDVFRLSGNVLANLVVGGDNVLAAEVHQFESPDTDVVFGSSMALVRALASETALKIGRASNVVCLSWSGNFLTLQRASTLSGTNFWMDVPGQVQFSPYCTTNPGSTTFYRLRN